MLFLFKPFVLIDLIYKVLSYEAILADLAWNKRYWRGPRYVFISIWFEIRAEL